MNATSDIMDNKKLYFILKVLALAVSIFIFALLLPMCDTVSDKWFSTWLQGTIVSGASVIFFIFWIVETIINWNKQN